MPQFHYTNRLSARDIYETGWISARPTTLHKDPFGRDEGRQTPPLVWLTINPILEGTTWAKVTQAGGAPGLINDLWRFVFPDEYAPLGLAEYADEVQIEVEWFAWMVRTGELCHSNYTTWRCRPQDIPSSDWIAVEVLSGYDDAQMPIWTPAIPKPYK